MRPSVLTAVVLCGAVHALPRPEAECNGQQISTSPTFSLVAKVLKTGLGLDVNNWVLTGAHSGAGQTLQVLAQVDPLDETKAGSYYQNGSMTGTEPATTTNADNILARGTGSLVAGMTFQPSIAPNKGNYVVSVNLGTGTRGAFVRYGGPDAGYPFPHLVGMSDIYGQFYTCNMSLYDPAEPVQALYWRRSNETTPANCADILLVAQCFGDAGNSTLYTQHLQPAKCFNKAIDFELPERT